MRVERDRIAELRASIDRRAERRSPFASARQLVQVYTAGTLPTCAPCIYLGHPVDLDGSEAEAAAATVTADTARTVPFVLLGGPAAVGDVLPVYAVGGRWVGRKTGSGGGAGGYPCGQCPIPRQDLTVSWTNLLLGPGSTTLVYSGSPTTQWISGCANQLQYELVCTQNQVEFRVYYFVSGSCPSGQSQYCSTIRTNPFGLTQTNLTCSPFLLTCTVTSSSCPNLASNGYTNFTVSL